MRQIYLTQIRPIFHYAYAVWYLRGNGEDVKWRSTDKLVEKLEVLQNRCLEKIAGAYHNIARPYLLKELYINPLKIDLERCASVFRARALDPDAHRSSDLRSRLGLRKGHPYDVLEV